MTRAARAASRSDAYNKLTGMNSYEMKSANVAKRWSEREVEHDS
jgi:hypothetical protein